MSKFEQELELMSEEEISALLRDYEEKYDLEAERSWSKEEIDELFKYMYASMAAGNHESAGEIFLQLKPILKDFRDAIGNEPSPEQKQDFEDGLELFTDWTLLALRFTPESREDFVCLPLYLDLFDAYEEAPEEFHYKKGRATLQMVHHYRYWKNQGGEPEVLEEEDRQFLEDAEEYFQEDADELIEGCIERGQWDKVVALKKSLYRFYRLAGKPNDAIRYMKQVVEDLPNTPDYHEADVADMYQELGRTFMQHQKFKVALKYFTLAKEIYEKGGEELEMFMFQAEGWMDECKKML